MAKHLKSLAGATGLEPATFGVTGRGFGSNFNERFDSEEGHSEPKTCDSTPGVETRSGAWTIALLVLFAASFAGLVAAAWFASLPCRPGDRALHIGGAMLVGGCQRRAR